MWSSATEVDFSGWGTDAWQLFASIGMPILTRIGGVMMFGLVLFVSIAAIKAILNR